MMRTYYLLTKPGIIFGNLVTALSGFLLASGSRFDLWLFLCTLSGLGCIIGSACVFNNYIDRNLDQKMARTKQRALARGTISGTRAILFAAALGIAGLLILIISTNWLAVFTASVGFFIYVVLYSFWKTHTSYATAIGSIAGAIPPVVGYCAAANRFDMGAALLFMILVFWQMPHFFSIAMYRLHEYTAASVPVLPITKGIPATKMRILIYVVLFILSTFLLMGFGYAGPAYLAVSAFLGAFWFYLALRGFRAQNDVLWARQMFRISLVVITVLCLVLSADALWLR